MNRVGMSVEIMTGVSYFFLGAALAFAVLAAVLFFVLDIAKCWKLVRGSYGSSGICGRKGIHGREGICGKVGSYGGAGNHGRAGSHSTTGSNGYSDIHGRSGICGFLSSRTTRSSELTKKLSQSATE
ncbi:MAG: hypothetical protein K2P63_00990, partial [Lachnospiraceae bacterium]|nr:hypothetical protein [Lachnospiraceae bacterium]